MDYEKKLKQYMSERKVEGRHLSFEVSCHSIADAAEAVNGEPGDFVKNVCMMTSDDQLIVAIVGGEENASSKKVGKALGVEWPRLARPEEILKKTGYPCGGIPSFGFSAIFLIDPKVLEKDVIYTGGGSENSLVKVSPKHLQHLNQATVVRIRR
ncbi:aminoacyl-tRNA deacylase [Simkania sp.]|uniref:aminoacyl-tRNA deacylase n=1 Tax=Simkania sp. TaxID=34094 RepID=UPI003B52784F